MTLISIRWIICLLGIYGGALVYMQRASMSVAIVVMTSVESTNSNSQNQTHECAADIHEEEDNRFNHSRLKGWSTLGHNEIIKPEFVWSETLQVCVLIFVFGY